MGCSRQVLVQVMLFQFLGPGLAQDGATSNFSPNSKSSLSGLSNEVLFVSGFLRKSAYPYQTQGGGSFLPYPWVNWLPMFFGWAIQFQNLMVFKLKIFFWNFVIEMNLWKKNFAKWLTSLRIKLQSLAWETRALPLHYGSLAGSEVNTFH